MSCLTFSLRSLCAFEKAELKKAKVTTKFRKRKPPKTRCARLET